ncbi:Ribokinase-like protein [Basidiobolus meristosporus CBS 931.73]|uniref:Ribokinase-like protein n=1 Tax=Basidiobolus meristosporus CBS 931.73 TaxID=1314790 RepID=A0A1Y1YFK6_9FUNG|nr:Ribokinase-like protein [Basidiobolus meristosporus CBS 931.73]|eukprot:ORX96820.1 Ribokinase-like protein [Basidiobolus meristosporus CBS 931.73]
MSQEKPRTILCIGPNPAFQSTLYFEQFQVGQVNRARNKTTSIGGKGQNFVLATEQYGFQDKVTLLQILGGGTGQALETSLRERGFHLVNVYTKNPTRSCTTVLDDLSGEMTELIEPSEKLSEDEVLQFEEVGKSLLRNGSDDLLGIALCGTFPSGVTGETFANILTTKPNESVFLLDAYKDVAKILETGKVNVMKINREELNNIVGGAHDSSAASDDIPSLARRFFAMYQVDYLAITNGPERAYLFPNSDSEYYAFEIPKLTSVLGNDSTKPLRINPLGAGDTCSAVFLCEYTKTKDAAVSLKHGLAAASASCLVLHQTAQFDMEVKRTIYQAIKMEKSSY